MLRLCSVLVLAFLPLGALAQDFGGPVRVVDGDTLDVGGTRVRLHGIDAPELGQTCTNKDGAVWDCGTWVAARLRDRIAGRTARCIQIDTDRYGRTVATCSVAGEDVGQVMVAQGWALAYRTYSMAYDLDEKRAVVAGLGLHAHRFDRPEDHRRAVRAERESPARTPAGNTCAIKGNISRSGNRIYHLPGQADYGRTMIRTDQGERWFCTETEARAAGWRPARR